MIKEIALDPSVVRSWDSLRLFTGHYGVHAGRLLACYPSNWRQLVVEFVKKLNVGDMDRHRIIEYMASDTFRHKMLLGREQSHYDSQLEWLQNALCEHRRSPFTSIVATANTTSDTSIVVAGDIDPNEDARLRPVNGWSIFRSAREIAASARPLLQISRNITFVDPWFRPDSIRYTNPLRDMLALLRSTSIANVEYHFYGNQEASKLDQNARRMLWEAANRCLPNLVPEGITLRLVIWHAANRLHNRYILTEQGGLQFGHGLDEGASGKDEVSLLEPAIHADLWRQFQNSPERKHWEMRTVKGTRTPADAKHSARNQG